MSAHKVLAGRFRDDRGEILDLIEGPIDAVTQIFTLAGSVRGNHYHQLTTQWTYVLTGSLQMANGRTETVVSAGDIFEHKPGEPHAWKALTDTDCLVFTRGPRSGENYEADTYRLNVPLLT